MAGTATPIFPQTVKNAQVQILPADTTTLKTLLTPGANGSRVDSILISSTDTANKDLQFVLTIGGVDYVIGTLTCPLNSGFVTGVALLSVFSHANFVGLNTDVNGNKFLFLASGSVLKVKALTTVTAAKIISLVAQYGDF